MINSSSDNVKKLNSINRRMFIMTAAKLVIFGGIITRLFTLQINENKKYDFLLEDKGQTTQVKEIDTSGI